MRYQITHLADNDIVQITEYIQRDNPRAADALEDRLHQTFLLLAEWPGIGHQRKDVRRPGCLFFTVKPYVIAYRHYEDGIVILRVLHGARDFRKLHFPRS